MNKAKIVAFGGGTGMSVLLRGIKDISPNITAVVTVADNGGSSGRLRDDLGILPPGDIRNCIIALSDVEPLMEKLMQYRFTEGELKGHCFGNLYLAAMSDLSGGFLEAIENTSDVLAVTGRVLPVTLDDVHLCALLEDGSVVVGETYIGQSQAIFGHNIQKVWLDRECEPLIDVIEAILEADIILLGPGSLYTSIIPNLLVPGITDAIKQSTATKIYIANLMTQPGETSGYSFEDHISVLEAHSYEGIADYAILNDNFKLPIRLIERYREQEALPVRMSGDNNIKRVIMSDFITIENDKIRHNYVKLTEAIEKIYKGQWD